MLYLKALSLQRGVRIRGEEVMCEFTGPKEIMETTAVDGSGSHRPRRVCAADMQMEYSNRG